ncbi:MAG TPA: amino acid permease [Prolixibacteraceae bacterium]|nr:amino acid permease [Prolixibacteraceae bacterium]
MEQAEGDRLGQKVGLFAAYNIVIANMIGAGIFTTSGLLMSGLSNPWLLIALWVVGGIIALCGALSYAELGAAMPHAGGEYVFLSRLYSPLSGFLSGWVSFVAGFSAPIAASAIGFSEYLFRAFPALAQAENNGILWGQHLDKILAIAIILLFTLIHLRGLEFGTRIQNYLTIMNVVLIALLIMAGLALGKGDFTHFEMGPPVDFKFGSVKTIGLSLMWILFAYSGWNASTYIGSEIKNPERNIPRSLLYGTGIVMLMYVLLNIVYVYATPPEQMKGVISIGGLTVKNLFGSSMEFAFSLLIAFALFSSLSAFIIIGPRVYYSMAKDGYFFPFVAKIHPKYHVPSAAILMQAAIAVVMVLSGTFDQILTYMGFSLGLFPLLAVAGVFKLRAEGKNKKMMPGFPIHLLIYLFFGILILVLSYLERPVESSIALFTALAGIPFFYYFKKQRKG